MVDRDSFEVFGLSSLIANCERGRIAAVLSFMFIFYFCSRQTNLSNQVYQYLYNNMDTVYYFDARRPRFLCTVYQGGLGNLLFQYSFSYMLSKTMNLTLLVPEDKMALLQEVFQIPNVTVNKRGMQVCTKTRKYVDKIDVGFDSSVFRVPNNTDIYFEGYFQSWVYWADYKVEIRKQLKFHPEIISKAKRVLSNAVKFHNKSRQKISLVGIHVRRGDMIASEYFRKHGYQVADKKYLANAMKYMTDHIKKEILFVVCSNDMKWTKTAIKVPNVIFVNSTRREVDMAVLTLCDHFIMTVGTFGWWAGFLSKGTVIYYNQPFRPNSELAKNFANDYNESFFYPGWIGMS
ncbi:hypothetical protein LOTGIDRAFT_167590 [Lottia gigantea]|uniref:L-Fucosyltransferase n=1 Tax=Lottia gigantea TaxID=225164 RepID=V4BAT4_LOTGI|nr:hypothetical protein LOTGIDRAFT_167590 [Lottia gigantea]ESO86084.1 hypothetical protein LOTGIDRAFT_167590 [Lottia gigantea]